VPADIPAVLAAADSASERTKLYGIHFVDEAMPMPSLLAFSRENKLRASGEKRPFHFWGNVRFDQSWTEDRCEYLAASGLVAVSGGIEIATERGLGMTEKGFDLPTLTRTLLAMKRGGLLVHAYLIYGFPGQSRADIVDSAEVCRQLFEAELIDSAFWHRFVLTRHSRMYAEWRIGKREGLEPVDRAWDFADNDLGFSGEGAYDEFDGPLAASLEAWMSGEGLERPAARSLEEAGLRAAGRGVSVPPGLIEGLLSNAAREEAGKEGRAHWIAGKPVLRLSGRGAARLSWAYRGESVSLELGEADARILADALEALSDESGAPSLEDFRSRLKLSDEDFRELRTAGLLGV
jgi:radical SAM superfamily enzyme YgiQ (UPF0313 family)